MINVIISFTMTIFASSVAYAESGLLNECKASASNVGKVCADGSVYAGNSQESNTPVFTTKCDAGQNWDGVKCAGSRTRFPWNDGNSRGMVATGTTNPVDGAAHTKKLVKLDADALSSGKQPHQAARYCANLSAHGHEDWYLPSKEELEILYALHESNPEISQFSTLASNVYWSSSETDHSSAIAQSFRSGQIQPYFLKVLPGSVRCIRK